MRRRFSIFNAMISWRLGADIAKIVLSRCYAVMEVRDEDRASLFPSMNESVFYASRAVSSIANEAGIATKYFAVVMMQYRRMSRHDWCAEFVG